MWDSCLWLSVILLAAFSCCQESGEVSSLGSTLYIVQSNSCHRRACTLWSTQRNTFVIVTSNAVTLWDVGQHYYLRLDTTVPFIGILTAAIDLLFGGLGYTCIPVEAMPVKPIL